MGQKLSEEAGKAYLHHRAVGPFRDSYSRDQLNVNVTRLRIGEIGSTKGKVLMRFNTFFSFPNCVLPKESEDLRPESRDSTSAATYALLHIILREKEDEEEDEEEDQAVSAIMTRLLMLLISWNS